MSKYRNTREFLEEVQQYARTGRSGNLTMMERLIAAVSDIFAGPKNDPSQRNIEEAISVLNEAGYGITPPGRPPAAPARTRPGKPPVRPRSRIGSVSSIPGIGERTGRQADEFPPEHAIDTRIVSAPLYRGEEDIFRTEIETPQSSNVFSFAYDKDQGILYVTYKAPGRERNGRRPHVRGPMYSYGGRMRKVPEHVYSRMKTASSKGSFVWDALRVRGTIYGHQYPYTLVSGAFMDDGTMYVPRKATRRGFRVRSVATVGSGRRSAERSTLPERTFR